MPHQALKILLLSLPAWGLSVSASEVAGGHGPQARVRVYQQAEITLYPGEYCYGHHAAGEIRAATKSFTIFSGNKREGMPVTGDIDAAYNEYIVPAGKPLTVRLQWESEKNGVKATCGPIVSTFYPQPLHDYDVSMVLADTCYIQVREIQDVGAGKYIGQYVPVAPSFACPGW